MKLEEKYKVTRKILAQLAGAECQITISTKSKLILRDMDLLKKFSSLKIAVSLNTLNEEFRSDMDKGSTVAERIETIKELHNAGFDTVLFMSPIYLEKNNAYSNELAQFLDDYSRKLRINSTNYFYHDKLVKK